MNEHVPSENEPTREFQTPQPRVPRPTHHQQPPQTWHEPLTHLPRPWYERDRFVVPVGLTVFVALLGLVIGVALAAWPDSPDALAASESSASVLTTAEAATETTASGSTSSTPVRPLAPVADPTTTAQPITAPTTAAPTTAQTTTTAALTTPAPTTAAPTTAAPTTPAPTTAPPTTAPITTAAPDCHPAYDPCLPNLAGDALNCGDLSGSQKPVTLRNVSVDPYGLDGNDKDGRGCEG